MHWIRECSNKYHHKENYSDLDSKGDADSLIQSTIDVCNWLVDFPDEWEEYEYDEYDEYEDEEDEDEEEEYEEEDEDEEEDEEDEEEDEEDEEEEDDEEERRKKRRRRIGYGLLGAAGALMVGGGIAHVLRSEDNEF